MGEGRATEMPDSRGLGSVASLKDLEHAGHSYRSIELASAPREPAISDTVGGVATRWSRSVLDVRHAVDMATDPGLTAGEAKEGQELVVSDHDRPVRILRRLVVIALGLSLAVPFAVVSIQDGGTAAFRWLLNESGVVGALLGCLTATLLLSRYWNRKREAKSP